MHKIVVASDSFKGSLSSTDVANSAERGIKEVLPQCEVVKVNVADGGEGTVDAIVDALGGTIVTVEVSDPLGRKIEAQYGIAGEVAILEMASASGLPLLKVEERNPLLTSTRGTGEMIMDMIGKEAVGGIVGAHHIRPDVCKLLKAFAECGTYLHQRNVSRLLHSKDRARVRRLGVAESSLGRTVHLLGA